MSERRLPTPFLAAFLYTLRVCVPPRRRLLLLLPIAAALLFGWLATVTDLPTPGERLASTADGLFGLVLPFACLIIGDSVLGAEVRSGAFALTWLSPAPFSSIVVARWLAGWVIASATLGPAFAAAAAVAGAADAIGPLVVATIAGCAGYIGIFVLVGATTRRAALWSLGIVLLGERLLGAVLAGIAQLSPQWLARSAYGGLGPDADDLLRDGVPSGWAAVLRLAVIAAVTVGAATWRVRHLRVVPAAE